MKKALLLLTMLSVAPFVQAKDLIEYASVGDVAAVTNLLNLGSDPNMENDNAMTPLLASMVVCPVKENANVGNCSEVMMDLLGHHADPDYRFRADGQLNSTLLMNVIVNSPMYMTAVPQLKHYGANMNAMDYNGNSALINLLNSHPVMAADDKNKESKMKEWAHSMMDRTAVLLNNGASPNVLDDQHETALSRLLDNKDMDYANTSEIINLMINAKLDKELVVADGRNQEQLIQNFYAKQMRLAKSNFTAV